MEELEVSFRYKEGNYLIEKMISGREQESEDLL